ncbi:hypothetical protein BJX99DRAFT_253837 [Aspergillus californicus]
MQQQPGNNLFKLLQSLLLWALIIPAISAEETTNFADLSQVGPDQKIDIAPLVPVNIKVHHGHGHEHLPRSSASATTFPTSFDTSLTNNFTTTSCPSFFTSFLSDSTFTNCHAISTLIRDSTSFFHTLSSAASTSHVLDIACAANVTTCASTMSSFASALLDDSNCAQDYEAGNPLVTNAYTNMITYEPIYRATCLQNPETSDYCFVDAAMNSSNSADYDIYLLPYGSTIVSAPYPTCNSCLQASLDIFSQWAQVDGQPLADSYLPTAEAVNSRCGADFANVNITAGEEGGTPASSAAEMRISPSRPVGVTLSVAVSLCLLLY